MDINSFVEFAKDKYIFDQNKLDSYLKETKISIKQQKALEQSEEFNNEKNILKQLEKLPQCNVVKLVKNLQYLNVKSIPKLIDEVKFKYSKHGKDINLYTLVNKNGTTAQLTNFGARLVNLWVLDKYSDFIDVVLGYNSGKEYVDSDEKYFGATVGRYANRICNGSFQIEETLYQLNQNNGQNALHGGLDGFSDQVWEVLSVNKQSIIFYHYSADKSEFYPGNLQVKVKYILKDDNELKIEYFATTDSTTIINLTHHSFFNLNGEANGGIYDHQLWINSGLITPINKNLIPTGEFLNIENTAFDFTTFKKMGQDINSSHNQLKYGNGYDHNYVLQKQDIYNSQQVIHAAIVKSQDSGIQMDVFTNEPGLQLYTGNFLNPKMKGKSGKPFEKQTAFCLEAQHFPNSPNIQHFPSTLLTPDKFYYQECSYKFSILKEECKESLNLFIYENIETTLYEQISSKCFTEYDILLCLYSICLTLYQAQQIYITHQNINSKSIFIHNDNYYLSNFEFAIDLKKDQFQLKNQALNSQNNINKEMESDPYAYDMLCLGLVILEMLKIDYSAVNYMDFHQFVKEQSISQKEKYPQTTELLQQIFTLNIAQRITYKQVIEKLFQLKN